MKILKILGIILVVIVLIGVGIVFFGPSSVHLERQTTIDAPIEAVFAEVSNMKSFNNWSPWYSLDSTATYMWEGPITGPGAKILWYSDDPNVGNGSMEIVERSESSVKYGMIFDEDQDGDLSNNENNPAYAEIILSEVEGVTQVTWTFDADNFTGVKKFFALMMESFLGPFYEQGLATLKERVEGRPKFTVSISIEEVDPIRYLGVEVSSSMDPNEISNVMREAYGKLMAAITEQNIQQTGGYPLAVTTNYTEEAISMICGIPIAAEANLTSESMRVMNTPEGSVIKAVHLGDYQLLEDSYNQLDSYASFYGLETTGMPWEIYVTDPEVETDTSKWVTEIYYPVK